MLFCEIIMMIAPGRACQAEEAELEAGPGPRPARAQIRCSSLSESSTGSLRGPGLGYVRLGPGVRLGIWDSGSESLNWPAGGVPSARRPAGGCDQLADSDLVDRP
jgi:hypothetical protein